MPLYSPLELRLESAHKKAPQKEIDEITVSGRKRGELLQDVPVSISAFTQDDLVEQGITNLQKLYEATPGLTFDTAHGDRNSSQPAVRGVQSTRVLSTLQKVTTFVDGIPMAGQVASLTFTGIDQVEVYSGPQSAAFGRATFAGAINYSTSDATEQSKAKYRAECLAWMTMSRSLHFWSSG